MIDKLGMSIVLAFLATYLPLGLACVAIDERHVT